MTLRLVSLLAVFATVPPLPAAPPSKSRHVAEQDPASACSSGACAANWAPAHRATFWSKDTNLVILNRLKDAEGGTHAITGIYAVPASCGSKARAAGIDWGDNLIKKPVAPGKYASLFIDTERPSGFHLRVDFEGADTHGRPYQYFHTGAVLYKKGVIVHQAILQLKDGSSPWTLDRVIDKNFGE